MLIQDRNAPPPKGFALFNLAFRPFFFLAALFAASAMALWGLSLSSSVSRPLTVAWHGHEMLFGYAVAVISGFLLTASRNWTGVRTPQGLALAGMAALWIVPRVAMPFMPSSGWAGLAVADLGFDLLLTAVLARTLWRNPANLWVFPPLLLALTAGNLCWWLAALGFWPDGHGLGLILGQGAAIGVLLVMGVRIAPFFIEKRLNVPVGARVPVAVYRTGAVLYGLLVVAELWVVPFAVSLLAGAMALIAAWVLWRWHAPGLWREPLLWVLWLAGAWLVVGFTLMAMGDPAGMARHALLAGALGLATLGMMARVSLGHSGRVVYPAPKGTLTAFLLLALGAVLRVILPMMWPPSTAWTAPLAALVWVLAFIVFLAVYAPMLWRPRVDGKPG